MQRRQLLTALGASLGTAMIGGVPALANQRQHFANGQLSAAGFDWNVGGGDPLRPHLRSNGFANALAIPRLNFTATTQREIQATLRGSPHERISLAMYEGQRLHGAVMMSGDGWLAFNPRINTHRWPNRQFGTSVWFVTTGQGRFQVLVPDVCSNLIFIPRGQALPCVCKPSEDACI